MIDRTKWTDLEFVRQHENGRLTSVLTRFGNFDRNNLSFVDPETINAYQADVTITAISNSAAEPQARLAGFFYDDGTPGAGFTGEVMAEVRIHHDGAALVAAIVVGRCNNPSCTLLTPFLFDTTTFGPVALGETHTLSLAWDGKILTFGYDAQTVTFDPTVHAAIAGPSQTPFRGLGTQVLGVGGPDEGASIAATFDNVLILAQCLRDGDVNQDNNITPADALLAFQQFLGVAAPPLDACQLERANALDPGVSGITPTDALCIFQKFLSLPSCLDNVE